MSVSYKVGFGKVIVDLPTLEQKPECGKTFDNYQVTKVKSSLASEQVLRAVSINSKMSTIEIKTDESSFVGETAVLTIEVDQSDVINAGTFTV